MGKKIFALGQTVRWMPTAIGNTRMKTGIIVKVVPANVPLKLHDLEREFPDCRMVKNYGHGLFRTTEFYIVQEPPVTSRAKPRLFWPLVSVLEAVTDNVSKETKVETLAT